MNSTFAEHYHISKAFIACLIISMVILGPLAPLSQASPSSSSREKAASTNAMPAPVPAAPAPVAAPLVPTITATKTDSFPDPDMDGKAAPGEAITYDVNIANSGTDASDVSFTDTIDSNTTLVPGSLKVSPLAYADVYSAAQNTPLSVGAPGVLTNDTGIPSPTAVAIAGGATSQGGTVTLNTDGSFLYTPAVGFVGIDTFTYTVTNGLTPNDTAQVTINVDAPPSVTATTPTNAATNQANNTDITITFSEAVNVTGNWFQIACTTSGTRNVADTVVTGGPTTFTINPNTDFTQNDTCTVTVFAAQVSDQDTNDPPDNMNADFVFSFETQDAAPSVTSTTPTNAATNQLTNTDITVTFSEPVDVTGNWFQIVCGSSGTRNPAATVVTGGPTTFTINPNADFAAAESCTVTIFAAQVADQDANDPPDNMAANFVFSFSTEAAPAVNATTPTNGATQVAANTNLTITFSEPVDVTGNWFQIVGATSGTRNVADTVVTGGPTTFTINPNTDFASGELVTVTVFAAQVTDQDTGDPPDNMAANFVFSFTIDQAPSVTATTPTNGATNVALASNISITFSEPVNVSGNWFQIVCPTTGTRNVADTVVSGGPTTFTINPNADFTFNETCTVTVFAAQVADQDTGDPPDNMLANFVFSFTTVDAAPTVTATTPTNGAVNQSANANIDVTFSEPVNVTGNWFQIVCTSSGTRLPAATVVTGGPTTFTINPNVDFTAGETCTVTIVAAQVADQDSNDPPDTMAANFVFSFTIDTAPAVTTTTPTNGATQVAANTNITINFNENVNIQDANAFIVECPVATPVTFSVSPVAPGGANSFTLDPTSDLPFGTTCTVTVVAAKVTDVDTGDPPDNMAANFVFSFTTDQAPSVTSTVPTNNAVNVPQNSTITINFSENVNVLANAVTVNCGSAVTLPAAPQNNLTALVLTPPSVFPAGSNCTVTVDRTKISDTDTADPPDNMVADFVFSFKVKPDAVDDLYPQTLVGNISTNSFLIPFSVTGNDVSANAFTITAVQAQSSVVSNTITTTSANGGNIVMTVSGTDMGKFTYDPPAGFEGSDTFTYTISRVDGGGSDTAIVTIPINGMVWFINNQAAGCTVAGCGRLSNPFSTLAAFNTLNNGTGNNPAANDNIFIFTGSGNYTGPLTLLNNQKVIGQGATSSITAISGLTPPSASPAFPATGGAKPTITTVAASGNNGINLASGNQLFGLAFSNTDGAAIRGTVNIGTSSMNGIVINNTGGGGIILTGGGTITITGTNTIVTTTATALNVSNTNIGASGITFQSISSSGGSNTGIILDTTGGAGGLTVTGDGANATVGGNASGGTIANKSGADNSTTTGIGIYLNNTANVVLRRMTINGTNQNFGIRGFAVNNFTLEFSTVNGTNGTNVAPAVPNGAGEGSIYFGNDTFTGMTGTGTITNCIIAGGRARNFSLINISGTLNRLVITGSNFGLNQSFIDATDNLSVESRNAGTVLNATVRGNTFTGAPGDLVEFVANSQSTMDLIMGGAAAGQPNALSNNHPNNNVGGGGVTIASGGTLTFNVSNNTMRDANGSAITLQMATPGGTSTLLRSVNGTFNANTIGVTGVTDSGSKTANGIFLSFADNLTAPRSQATVAITNNIIRRYHGIAGISADNTGGAYDVNLTITGNTTAEPEASAFGGLVLGAGAPASTDDIDVCASITGNNFSAGAPVGGIDVFMSVSSGNSTIRLPGLTTPATQAQIEAFVLANNNVAGTTVSANADAPATFAANYLGGAACTPPSAMVLPLRSTERDTYAVKREVNRTVPKTLSHHVKFTKRDAAATTSTDTARNTAVSSTVTSPAVSKPAVNNPVVNKIASRPSVNAQQDKTKRGGVVLKPGVRADAAGGETVTHSVGTLLAGKTVHIQFQVTVNSPYLGGASVSNQGTVSGSNFSDVLTDDPAVGGANDPTQTPILLTPNVSVADAQSNEPTSGTTPMLFTIALSAPAGASGASVHYATADQSLAAGHAVAGVDYTAVPDTVLNFAAGEQFKTVSVDILADGAAGEPDETFLLNLSNPTNALISDGQAIGTIKQGNASGTFLISEIRTSGPGGAGDDFVELYNNSDTPLTIAASDASGGYGLFKMGATCNDTPVLIGTIPNGTVIPARGHYLFVGSQYSLANYGGTGAAAGDQTLSSDIENDRNVAIFTTASVANLSSVTRLDAVGFGSNTGANCELLREGTTLTPLSGSVLEYSYSRDQCGKKGNPAIFGPCPTAGFVADTNDNANDFVFVDTSASPTPAGQRLGAPGPENSGNPRLRNTITVLLLDSNIGAPAPPNRVRDFTPVTNGANGTLSVRRRFVNNTGAAVTRLRFRIVDISSIAVPGGIADIRALTSTSVVVSGITDAATCQAANGVPTTPCSVTVQGTTLEQPPAQAMGGAHNSSLSAGTITLATPLAPGASINLQFLLGVQQSGSFKFFFNIEALP
jgi:methionine-rich copper-binding protein CopC